MGAAESAGSAIQRELPTWDKDNAHQHGGSVGTRSIWNERNRKEKAHDRYDDYGTGFSYWDPASLDRVVKGGKVFPFTTGISNLPCP